MQRSVYNKREELRKSLTGATKKKYARGKIISNRIPDLLPFWIQFYNDRVQNFCFSGEFFLKLGVLKRSGRRFDRGEYGRMYLLQAAQGVYTPPNIDLCGSCDAMTRSTSCMQCMYPKLWLGIYNIRAQLVFKKRTIQ